MPDDDILEFLGLKADPKEHPADKEVLDFLGLKPVKEDHPAYTPPPGFEDPEARMKTPSTNPPKTTLQKVYEATDPSTVIPAAISDIGGNIAESAGASANMALRGAGKLLDQPATGLGEMVLGTAGVGLSPLTGTVKSGENALSSITGNPDFASKAALMFPINAGGPALRTAAHNIHPTTKAADFIAEKVGADNMPELLARLRQNPRLRPIDANDQLRMSGQGLIASPDSPMASRALTENMRASATGARDAVKGTYNDTMGTPPDAFEELQRLQNKAKSVGQAKIAPPLITAKPVDTSSVIADIDKALNPAAVKMTPGTTITPTPLQQKLMEVRQKLASGDKEVLTDADRLHDIQADLRHEADDLMSSATGSDRTLGRELKNYRNKLVDSIDASAPGYKKGLEAYRDQKDIERAFQFGQSILKNTQDAETAPGFLKRWMADPNRSPEELAAAKTGARQAIEQKMGSIKQSGLDPARSGTDVPQVDFNRQKLETLFGKENTDKMFQHLQDERDIALTNNRGLGNSKTAETQAAERELRPREIARPHSNLPGWALSLGAGAGALSGNPTLGAIAGGSLLAARGAKSGYDWLARRGEVSRNNSIADLLTRNDPEALAALSVAAQRIGRRNKLSNLLAPP